MSMSSVQQPQMQIPPYSGGFQPAAPQQPNPWDAMGQMQAPGGLPPGNPGIPAQGGIPSPMQGMPGADSFNAMSQQQGGGQAVDLSQMPNMMASMNSANLPTNTPVPGQPVQGMSSTGRLMQEGNNVRELGNTYSTGSFFSMKTLKDWKFWAGLAATGGAIAGGIMLRNKNIAAKALSAAENVKAAKAGVTELGKLFEKDGPVTHFFQKQSTDAFKQGETSLTRESVVGQINTHIDNQLKGVAHLAQEKQASIKTELETFKESFGKTGDDALKLEAKDLEQYATENTTRGALFEDIKLEPKQA